LFAMKVSGKPEMHVICIEQVHCVSKIILQLNRFAGKWITRT